MTLYRRLLEEVVETYDQVTQPWPSEGVPHPRSTGVIQPEYSLAMMGTLIDKVRDTLKDDNLMTMNQTDCLLIFSHHPVKEVVQRICKEAAESKDDAGEGARVMEMLIQIASYGMKVAEYCNKAMIRGVFKEVA